MAKQFHTAILGAINSLQTINVSDDNSSYQGERWLIGNEYDAGTFKIP